MVVMAETLQDLAKLTIHVHVANSANESDLQKEDSVTI